MIHNKLLKRSAALALAAVMLLGVLAGCRETAPTETPDAGLTGCTVEIKSAGGKALEGVGVYVYTDATKTDMIDYARTDANGIAAISNAVPAGGVAVLDKVPEGYTAQESYTITATETKITLDTQLRQQIGKLALGDVMFDFTVTDTNGVNHTLSELLKTKKAVVINLWYVNCNPCKAEFPFLIEAYGKYASDIEVLAINPEGDNAEAIAAFVTEFGLTFPAAEGDAAWRGIMDNLAYPTTIIVDRFGTVGLIHTGGIDSAKVFADAFAYFVADGYVQSTLANITDAATPDTAPPTEPTQAPTEDTQPTEPGQEITEPAATAAPTEKPTEKPTQAPTEPKPTAGSTAATEPKPTAAPTQAPTQKPTTQQATAAPTQKPTAAPTEPAGPNGTLVNPDEPVEQYGFVDFSIEVGAGEKKLVSMIRTINVATLCINDKDAYVIHDGKTYTPSNGTVSVPLESEGSFTPLVLEIGNSGTSDKTFNVEFRFAEGSRENPIAMQTGNNTVDCIAGNDQGTFYTFEATKAGTLTLEIKSVDPSSVILNVIISDMQEIPTVVEMAEGETTVSIDLPAGSVAEIMFSTADPVKEWKIPEAQVLVKATFA